MSVVELIRRVLREKWLRLRSRGPIALWDGEPRRTSIDHDSVHDDV